MLIYVPLAQIEDNPFQKRFNYDEIEELAADILSHKATRPDTLGLQQVPNGRLVDSDDGLLVPVANLHAADYLDGNTLRDGWCIQLEFGHRRKRAFAHLLAAHQYAYAVMPVHIRDLTDDQMLDGVWSENRQRRNLSAVEEAELLRDKLARLQANGGGSQRDLAESWGLARPTVANRLRLLELPAEIQQANREGKLSERQCLALATVSKLVAVGVKGRSWSDRGFTERYGCPIHPEKAIEEVIKRGDEITSDQIRDYTTRALGNAGETIPPGLAGFDCEPWSDGDGLAQFTCKGCPVRINEHCLRPTCLAKKKDLYGQAAGQAAAADLGLAYSDNPKHFEGFKGWDNTKRREDLRAVYDAGVSADVVVGYALHADRTVRPYYGDGFISDSDLWKDGGRNLVIIGHKSPVTSELLKQAQAARTDDQEAAPAIVEDIPTADEIEAWKAASDKAAKAAIKRAEAAIAEALDYELAATDAIQALVIKPDADWLDPAEFRKVFVKFLIDKGQGLYISSYHNWMTLENCAAALNRAGIGEAAMWPDEAARVVTLTQIALTEWYKERKYEYSTRYIEQAQERIPMLQSALNQLRSGADLMAVWSVELDRAWRDVEAIAQSRTKEVVQA